MYHVKAVAEDPPGGLDLNVVDEEEFSSDKLRSNIERLYMTVVSTPCARGLSKGAFLIGRIDCWNGGARETHGKAAVME